MTFDIIELAQAMCHSIGMLLSCYKVSEDQFQSISNSGLDIERLFEESGIKRKLCNENYELNNPLFVSNSINCIWIAVQSGKESKDIIYIIGPTLIGSISKELVMKYYYQKGVSLEDAAEITKQYEKIPIVPYSVVLQFFNLVFYVFNGKKADLTNLTLSSLQVQDLSVKRNEEEIYNIQQRDFSMAMEAEKYIHDCIRNGDLNRLKERRMNASIVLTNLGPNEIRSYKNTFIIAIALITRAAMDGGLPVETAFPLSDMYILQIESISEITPVMELFNEAIIDFATRVQKNKYKLSYSKPINKCCGYIVANVNNSLKVTEIAKVIGLHEDTLAKRFKKEVGTSITEYIRQTKIEEAKMLLLHSDKTLTEVSNLLGFSTQSQFIVSFKRVIGKTPNEFRKERNKLK